MPPLPALEPETEFFWTSGADGVLRFLRCGACDRIQHPPMPVCIACGGELEPAPVAGTGTVVGVTVNAQQWLPDLEPPYTLVLVAIDEDPLVRLTSRMVDGPGEVRIGDRVRVAFEHHDDVWLPLFEPTGERPDDRRDWPEPPPRTPRPRPSDDRYEAEVAITGVGTSEVGRRLMRDPMSLALDACNAAVADAGLDMADIDGISTYPGGGARAHGHSEGGIHALEEALRIHPTWFCGTPETPGQGGSIVNAMLAVAAGLCRHVLCVRTVWETTSAARAARSAAGIRAGGRVDGDMQWRLPFGAMSAANWIAFQASHHFHRYGTTREQLGWIPITERTHAGANPEAIYREPMTLDDYLGARMVTSPFGLYDCDVPCDGSIAVIVSAVDVSRDLAQPPVLVDAVGTQITERVSWDQGTLLHEPLVDGPAQHLWARSTLSPIDVDIACLYDGFSFNCLSWMEALGFCAEGEGGAFVDGGERITHGGAFVLNPHGGQLSAGRTHGYGFVREAVLQLRGQAGDRQVVDADVAVVTTGGGHPGSAFLFTR